MRFLDYKKTEVKIIHIQTCVRLAHTLRLKNPEPVRAQADAEGRTRYRQKAFVLLEEELDYY